MEDFIICIITYCLNSIHTESWILSLVRYAFIALYLKDVVQLVCNALRIKLQDLTMEIVITYIKNRALRVYSVLKKLFVWVITRIKNLFDK